MRQLVSGLWRGSRTSARAHLDLSGRDRFSLDDLEAQYARTADSRSLRDSVHCFDDFVQLADEVVERGVYIVSQQKVYDHWLTRGGSDGSQLVFSLNH